MKAEPTLWQVLGRLVRRPQEYLIRRWNWKSAVLSSISRACLFFAANLSVGFNAAGAAFLTELAFRGTTAGFYGALTQALKDAQPHRVGNIAAMVLLPLTSHLVELLVHWLRGTPELAISLAASVAMTIVTTSFNLFAMRRGALVVGGDSESIWTDLKRMPRLIAAFAASIARITWRVGRRVFTSTFALFTGRVWVLAALMS